MVDDDLIPSSRTPARDVLIVEPCVAIDLVQLMMNFDRRCALCIQTLYHRWQFTVGECWNKSLELQPLQLCYCENSGSLASACVMRRHYSVTYMQSLHTINGSVAAGRVGNLLSGCPSFQAIEYKKLNRLQIPIVFYNRKF